MYFRARKSDKSFNEYVRYMRPENMMTMLSNKTNTCRRYGGRKEITIMNVVKRQ